MAWFKSRSLVIESRFWCWGALEIGLALIVLVLLSGCGGSNGGSGGSGTEVFSEYVPAEVASSRYLYLQKGESDGVRIAKGPDRTLITDISETALGLNIDSAACDPPDHRICEQWTVTATGTAAVGGYRVGVSDIFQAQSSVTDDGFFVSVLPPEPAPAVRLSDAVSSPPGQSTIATGFDFSLAVATDGSLWAWGNHVGGQLGDSRINGKLYDPVPKRVSGIDRVVQVTTGSSFTLMLREDGLAYGMGANSQGQLGNSTQNDSSRPTQVAGLTGVEQLSAGTRHALALVNEAGTKKVYAWGSFKFGELGQAEAVATGDCSFCSDRPLLVNVSQPLQVAAGSGFSLALDEAGTVWFWGDLDGSENMASVSSRLPTPVPGLASISRIAASGRAFLALKNDGTVWVWGLSRNSDATVDGSTLGAGENPPSAIAPVQIIGLNQIVDITAGAALTRTGEVYQINSDLSLTKLELPSATPVVDITSGGGKILMQVADCTGAATLRAFGSNTSGSLGDGSFTRKNTHPALVIGLGEADSSCPHHVVFYKAGAAAAKVKVTAENMLCNDDVCWSSVANSNTAPLAVGFETADPLLQIADPVWDCANINGASSAGFELLVRDDVYCKLSITETPTPYAAYGLSLKLFGGPNAGEVSSDINDDSNNPFTCRNGAQSSTNCYANFTTGSEVLLTATATAGQEVLWDGCSSVSTSNGKPVCRVTMDNRQYVTARFLPAPAAEHTLTVILQGGPGAGEVRSNESPIPQIDCISSSGASTSCSAIYAHGTTVELSETTFNGYVFDAWSGCTPGLNAFEQEVCRLTLESDRVVVANYAPARTLTLTIAGQVNRGTSVFSSESPPILSCLSPDTAGTSCQAEFAEGADVLLDWNNFGGFALQSWSGCMPELDSNNRSVCRLTMNGNQAVTATFGP